MFKITFCPKLLLRSELLFVENYFLSKITFCRKLLFGQDLLFEKWLFREVSWKKRNICFQENYSGMRELYWRTKTVLRSASWASSRLKIEDKKYIKKIIDFFYLGTKLNCTNGIIVITVLFKPQWNQLTCWMSCLCSSLSALKREDWWKMEGLSLTLYQKKWQSFWNSIHRKDSWTLLAFPVFWRFIALYYTVYW